MIRISLEELEIALDYIKKNSHDLTLSVKEEGRCLFLTASKLDGSILEAKIYDDKENMHPRVSESRTLMTKLGSKR